MKKENRYSSIRTFIYWKNEVLPNLENRIISAMLAVRDAISFRLEIAVHEERGDVPGWVLVVLMTTGLVTAIWAIAAPRLSSILRNSLDSMNNVR